MPIARPSSALDEHACSYCGGHIGLSRDGLVYAHKMRRVRADRRSYRVTPIEYITTKTCPGGGWKPMPLERIPALLAAIKYPHTVQQIREDQTP